MFAVPSPLARPGTVASFRVTPVATGRAAARGLIAAIGALALAGWLAGLAGVGVGHPLSAPSRLAAPAPVVPSGAAPILPVAGQVSVAALGPAPAPAPSPAR